MGSIAPVAVTMGEPSGIGGEITLAAWRRRIPHGVIFFAIDDPRRLGGIAERLGWPVPVRPIASPAEAEAVFPQALPVLPLGETVAAPAGRPDPRFAAAVRKSIEIGAGLCRDGGAEALVTNPIQKEVMYRAGFPFPGHTEFLAALAGPGCTATMMLVSPDLRVVPVSIHVALRQAIDLLTTAAIERAAVAADAGLRHDFGIARPRLAIAGLNPHAGEEGTLGTEDRDIIAPAVLALQRRGIDARGPLPPDTMFHAAARRTYDAAICMYHDQALIPLKTLDFDRGVNVTLGLPIVRTSPDHGTALDIAGQGLANPESLIAALALASSIAAERRKSAR